MGRYATMKKNCRRFAALMLAVVLIIAALPPTASAADGDNISAFSNITCTFDRRSSKIKLEYRMKSEDVKKYADCEIKLYALSASQSIDDIPSLEPKVKGLSPSNRAGAEVRYEGLRDRLSSYVFAMETEDGLICSEPILPQVDSTRPDLPFKGIETMSTALTVGTVAGTVVVDIDTDSLITNGQGYLYTTSDHTYTFSSTYLDLIDDLIMLYRGAGRRILFRLAVGEGTYELYSDGYEIQRTVYACVSFLYSRYDADDFGGINGFVIGNEHQTTPELAERYGYLLYAAAAGLNDIGASCPLIVPVGDDFDKTTAFLNALIQWLGESPMFTLMLESHHDPYGVDDEYLAEFEENNDATNSLLAPSDASSSYISAENINRLTRLIDRRYKNSIYQDIIYNWTLGENVTGEAAVASYVYNYYSLFQNGRIESFIFSPGDRMEKSFIDVVKYINTNKGSGTIDFERISAIFGIDEWDEHFDRYDVEKLQNITVKRKSVQTGALPRFIGTVDYFNFSSSTDLSGWYVGQNCSGIYTDTAYFGRYLNAELSFPDDRISGAAFVSYTYRYSESFRYTDYITVDLSVESESSADKYNVTVSIGGAGFVYEYTAQNLSAGSHKTLYLDVREFDESMVTDYLRVTVEPREGEPESASLCIYSVKANSIKYNSDRLKNYILSERERLKSDDSETLDNDIGRNATVFSVGILVITALIMLTISRRRKKELQELDENKQN